MVYLPLGLQLFARLWDHGVFFWPTRSLLLKEGRFDFHEGDPLMTHQVMPLASQSVNAVCWRHISRSHRLFLPGTTA